MEKHWKTKLYTKLSTIFTKKYHKCGTVKCMSSSKVCFGICDKITKKGEERKHTPKNSIFGQNKRDAQFCQQTPKNKQKRRIIETMKKINEQ